MNSLIRFKINSPKVIFDLFDDEVVIINLESGCYYNADKSGFDIWKLLMARASLGEIIESLSSRFSEPSEKMSVVVNNFVAQLTDESLIVPSAAEGESIPLETKTSELNHPPALFELPVLHKYADMKDLLLLDPIHDVDERGWPIAKK